MPPRKPVQVPGESPIEIVQDDQPIFSEEVIEVKKSTLDALLARIDALESGSKITRRGEVGEQLPHAASIDQSKLKSPVLTKDGWVVPDTFGSNPAQKAL